jgi:hypothetical protein
MNPVDDNGSKVAKQQFAETLKFLEKEHIGVYPEDKRLRLEAWHCAIRNLKQSTP